MSINFSKKKSKKKKKTKPKINKKQNMAMELILNENKLFSLGPERTFKK